MKEERSDSLMNCFLIICSQYCSDRHRKWSLQDSFWFFTLKRWTKYKELLHLLLFLGCYTVRPVTRMIYVVCHRVVSDGVSSQLVKLQIFPGHAFHSFGVHAHWSDIPHHMDKQLTVSLAVYACVCSTGCLLFSVSPLSRALAY